jgi:integrase/recombinase XerD
MVGLRSNGSVVVGVMEQSLSNPKSNASDAPGERVLKFPESGVSLSAAYVRGLPSEATRTVYRRAIRQFTAFMDGDVLAASRRDVEAYRAHLEALGRAPSTVAVSMTALSGYFSFALDEGSIERNPAGRARRPKVPSVSPRQGLSPAEVGALLDVLDLDTLIGRRDRVLVLLLAVQAWRISEALGLRVEDLGEEGGHRVATITGKGSKVSRVTLAGTTWRAIGHWRAGSGIERGPLLVPVLKGGRVVPGKAMSPQSAWRRIRRLGEQAGLTRPAYPHLLRHAAATALLDRGVPLRDVQDHLRHADPRTTRRYDSHRMSLDNESPHVLAAAFVACAATR